MNQSVAFALMIGVFIVLLKVVAPDIGKYFKKNREIEARLVKYTTVKQVPYLTNNEKEQNLVDAKNYVYKNKSYICRARYEPITIYGEYIRDENGDMIKDDTVKTEQRLVRNAEARYQVVNPDGDILFEKTIDCPNPTYKN